MESISEGGSHSQCNELTYMKGRQENCNLDTCPSGAGLELVLWLTRMTAALTAFPPGFLVG